MQQSSEQTKHFAKILGKVIKDCRENNRKISINQLANEYDLDVGNTSRIENGLTDAKLLTVWKISEALGIKLSDLIKILEDRLGQDFHFFEE